MTSNNLIRWGALSSLLGGVAFVLLSLESIARPDPEGYRTALFLIPWLFSAGGIVGLHALQRERSGRLGRVGFWVTIAGVLAATAGTLANLADVDALLWLEIPVGPAVWIVGMVLLGVATIRARVVPSWAGVALILAEPMTVLVAVALSPWVPLEDEGSYSGAVANGIAFLALGIALRAAAGETMDPAREGEAAPAVA